MPPRMSRAQLDRVLFVQTESPEQHLGSYSSTSTIAPRDVFWDYHHVMNKMRRERAGEDTDVDANSSAGDTASETLLNNTGNEDEDNDDDDYQEKPSARPVGRKANKIDIASNGRAPSGSAARRKARKTPPYQVAQSCHATRVLFTDIPKMCPYMNLKTGKPCKSANPTKRHLLASHILKEARMMLMGDMTMLEGDSVRTQETLDMATRLLKKWKCPRCDALPARSDLSRRHQKTCNAKHANPKAA